MSVCVVEDKKRYAPSITESIYSSKVTSDLQRRKLMMIPGNGGRKKNDISEIILSAREKKLKHLRSQLTDSNFKLTELSKENVILKSIQKRHEAALQRYESVNGDIPKLMTGQSEEIRKWQMRYKELHRRYREATQVLNKKNLQFNKLTEEYEHLTKLSKEENLGELDDLQEQIITMTHKLEKQQETIDCLQRRLVLDEKAHKHKINLEREKRRNIDTTSSQQSDETVSLNANNVLHIATEGTQNKTSKLPISRKISQLKSIISEYGILPPMQTHFSRSTIIPKLQIPIPETDRESLESSENVNSFRTKTISRRSESYNSDFNEYNSE